MNKTPKFHSPEIATSKEIRAVDTPFLSFEKADGVAVYTSGGHNFLVIDSDVEYPEFSGESEINDLLLPQKNSQGERHLQLPDNFVTLPQILNDAIGDNTSGRSQELARNAFASLGRSLGRIALIEHAVPTNISYKNVIFSREDSLGTPRVLPPIKFQPFDVSYRDQAWVQVINDLRQSVTEGASNTTQQGNILTAFGGFIKSYDW